MMKPGMAEIIAMYGRTVMGVFPTKETDDPVNDSFSYSIGNAAHGLPELLVIGMCQATFPINDLSDTMLKRGRKFDDGEMVNLGGKYPVCVIDAADTVKARYTIQATYWNGAEHRYAVMQVVCPDPAGRFPWQEGCAEPFSRVIVHRRMAS